MPHLRLAPAALLAAALIGSSASLAHADPARAKAEQHAKSAEAYFRQDRFDAALEEYIEAKESLPLPAFLFNIGQCHRAMGEWELAIRHFEEFLAHTDDASEKKAAEAMIADCKAVHGTKAIDLFGPDEVVLLLPPQGTPLEIAAVPPPEPPLVGPTPKIEPPPVIETPPVAPPALVEAEVSTAVEKEPMFYEKWWFWTAIGGAVAVIVGGTVIGVTAGGDEIVELPRGSAGTLDWR